MNSMTGFGKNEVTEGGRRMRAEVKSVNHRFLDINIRIPRFLMFLEDEARGYIKSRLSRGRVDVFINFYSEENGTKKVAADMGLIASYYEAAKKISAAIGTQNNVNTAELMRLPDAVTPQEDECDEEALKALLLKTLEGALDELTRARDDEGKKLWQDMLMRLDIILKHTKAIEAKEDSVVSEYKRKLEERITEILGGAQADETRLAQEVAFFADRCNITEEIVRIKSHVNQFKKAENSKAAQGRNLDFIVQELNREFNTIGSKSSDLDITNAVILCKGEVEKIREQIQNIE